MASRDARRLPSELHRIHDRVEVQPVAQFEEIVAQRGDVDVRRNADGDLRLEHVRAGLHRAVARRMQLLDADARAG